MCFLGSFSNNICDLLRIVRPLRHQETLVLRLGECKRSETRFGEIFNIDPDCTPFSYQQMIRFQCSEANVPGAFVGGISPSRPAFNTPQTIWLLALSWDNEEIG